MHVFAVESREFCVCLMQRCLWQVGGQVVGGLGVVEGEGSQMADSLMMFWGVSSRACSYCASKLVTAKMTH